jgi:hypothetical protein
MKSRISEPRSEGLRAETSPAEGVARAISGGPGVRRTGSGTSLDNHAGLSSTARGRDVRSPSEPADGLLDTFAGLRARLPPERFPGAGYVGAALGWGSSCGSGSWTISRVLPASSMTIWAISRTLRSCGSRASCVRWSGTFQARDDQRREVRRALYERVTDLPESVKEHLSKHARDSSLEMAPTYRWSGREGPTAPAS